MKFCNVFIVTMLSMLTVAVGAGAETYSGPTEYGNGANQATIVVDFDENNYFLFTYNWDGAATGWDAIDAIDQAGALDVFATDYGDWGMFVSDFDYPDGVEYDYGTANTGWAYYVGTDNENWSLSGDGVSFRELGDGDWDSWVWTNYDANWAAIRTPGAAPAPEPATMALLALGSLTLLRRKRRA